mgnify:CR=1 FL=1
MTVPPGELTKLNASKAPLSIVVRDTGSKSVTERRTNFQTPER